MERISVLVRVRPLDKQESPKGSPWKITGNTIFLFPQGPKFEFDRVFGEESKTMDIYDARTKDIVAAAVRGFNGTVFAYGQTSSGKTHTMRGSSVEPGVIPLAVRDVFRNIEEAEDREFLLRMSYMEIYNEEINDLLVPEHRKLQVHESLERGIFVAGLREEIVATPEQVLQFMDFGESHRHVGETNMNLYSSRSHTIFRMVIESRDKNGDDSIGMSCDAVRVSVLNLVDLAGSERIAKTGAEGARLKEGSHINKSLMTLGTVINKLSEGVESQGGHVPYRDSKLTRILQPALGGNAKTAIICNITPALIHVDETKGTLQFASRALRVTNCAQVNEVMTDAALLKRQKKEIEELRAKLQGSHSEHLADEILNLRNTLLQSELERERIALELQEEKKAQAERERQLKEQAQKIENLSTIVLYSAMDDREKRVKKNARRETWCPTVPLKEFSEEDFGRPSKGALGEIVPGRRDRDLPPPFQKLCEEQESTNTSHTSSKDSGHAVGQGIMKENGDVSSSWVDCPLPDASASVHVTDRKKKSSVETMTLNEAKDELLELQTRYQDLECQYENQRKIKNSEIEDLKKRLTKAEAAANKQQKVNKLHLGQSTDRRGKSLTGWESEAFMLNKQLEDQVKTLELEKLYMQRDLDRIMELAKEEKENAKRDFEELQEELKEVQEEAANTKEKLDSALAEIKLLKKEKEENLDKVLFEFDELRNGVESLRATVNEIESVTADSIQAFLLAEKCIQEFSNDVADIKCELYHLEIKTRSSECAMDFKRGDGRKSAICENLSHRGGEEIVSDNEFEKCNANVKVYTDPCSTSDLVPSSGRFCQYLNQKSQSIAQGHAGEEMFKLPFTKCKLSATSTFINLSDAKEIPLAWQLDNVAMHERTEIVSSVSNNSNMDAPGGIDILGFLQQEKQHAIKLLGELRNLSQHEELFTDNSAKGSGLDEVVSDLRCAISESSKLLSSIWMQGHSKSCSDIEVTEVHVAISRGMPDNSQTPNETALTPYLESHFSNSQSKNDANTEMMKGYMNIGECDSSVSYEQALQSESDAAEVLLMDDLMMDRPLCEGRRVTSSCGINQRLGMPYRQCETGDTFSDQVDQNLGFLSANDVGLDGLDVTVDGLNAEIKSLRGKVECLEADMVMAIEERSRSAEAETVACKQLESVQAALQLSKEEKDQLQEVHSETLIKLQTLEKEVESHRHDLDALCKNLEQCNFEKTMAEEKICQLELFISKKIEEQNTFFNEHKITCEALMKTTDELEKEVKASMMPKMLINDHESACIALRKKLQDLETEKAQMADQIIDGHQKLEELKVALESVETIREEQDKAYITEKTQLMKEVSSLRKEVAKLASSSLMKERDSLRKELDKMKLKLKDTESKFRNILQEKSKLEAEKANTDREIKLLRGQSSLLRDISKRESLADKRRESKAFDLSKAKNHLGLVEQSLQLKTMELERANFDLEILQENYKKLEITVAEVEDKLATSEGELLVANEERETLASECQVLSEKLKVTSSELSSLHEKHDSLNQQLQDHEGICKQLEDSLSATLKEKQEIAMQLTDVLLQLEEDRAVCSSREKASIEALREEESRKLSLVNAEVSVLKENLQKLKLELESSKDQCKHLSEQLSLLEVNSQEQRRVSSLELDKLREDLHRAEAEHEISENAMKNTVTDLKLRAEVLSSENEKISGERADLRKELERVNCERDELCSHAAQLRLKLEEMGAEKLSASLEQSELNDKYNEIQCKWMSAKDELQALTERKVILEEKLANEKMNFIKETTKLQVRLRSTRAKLDAFHGRYVEVLDEFTVMHRKFTEDSRKLKEQLVAARLESFELKKQLISME